MHLPFNYGEIVKVSGVDEIGHKELFDDFEGEFLGVEKGQYMVSDETSIYHVHPSQVSKM